MSGTHKLINGYLNGTQTIEEAIDLAKSGEMMCFGELKPSEMENGEVLVSQAARWVGGIDEKLGKCYKARNTRRDSVSDEVLGKLYQKRMMTKEEYLYLTSLSFEQCFDKIKPLSRVDFFTSRRIFFRYQKPDKPTKPSRVDFNKKYYEEVAEDYYQEALSNWENNIESWKQKVLEIERSIEDTEQKYKNYVSSSEGDKEVKSHIKKKHSFLFVEHQIGFRKFLEDNPPTMEGYMRFLEKMAKIIPKPFKKMYEKNYCSISPKILKSHAFLVGNTGSGKTELIKFIIHGLSEVRRNGKNPFSIVVIEPDGEFCRQLARHKDFDRENTLLFDVDLSSKSLEDGRKLPAYNPFDFPHKDIASIDSYSQNLTEAFAGIIGKEFTPNMKNVIKSCFQVLLRMEGATFDDLLKMLSENTCEPYVKRGLAIPDKYVRDSFREDFMNDKYKVTKDSLNTRFRSLIDPTLYRVISQQKSTFDIEDICNNGKIALFGLNGLGRTGGSILGRLLYARITHIAFSRKMAKDLRPETYVFMDECQNYLNESVYDTLTEGRKYRLYLALATQTIKQLNPKDQADLTDIILSNTNAKFSGLNDYSTNKKIAPSLRVTTDELDTAKMGEFYLYTSHLKRQTKAFKIYVPNWYIDWKGRADKEVWKKFIVTQLNTFYTNKKSEKIKEYYDTIEKTHKNESNKERAERVQNTMNKENEKGDSEGWAFD